MEQYFFHALTGSFQAALFLAALLHMHASGFLSELSSGVTALRSVGLLQACVHVTEIKLKKKANEYPTRLDILKIGLKKMRGRYLFHVFLPPGYALVGQRRLVPLPWLPGGS